MKFTDIKIENRLSGSYNKDVICLKQNYNHDIKAEIELITEEDEEYLEIRTYVKPGSLAFGENQPCIAFQNFDCDDMDLWRAENDKSDKLMNLLENIRKALSFLLFGDAYYLEFPLKDEESEENN